jgi:hypothetical protein
MDFMQFCLPDKQKPALPFAQMNGVYLISNKKKCGENP